ncbi:MAG TPA: aminoacyl-tRNA hydrolase, partial [Acidimicrobiales bacterium]|nr:aminoacyl-tRNA hydrolase [Acidimicrobiales bacterium]
SSDFTRVRIGIGKPPGRQSGADFVLRRPSKQDREQLNSSCETAASAIEVIFADGVGTAMNRFNG